MATYPRDGVHKLQKDDWCGRVQSSILAEMMTDGVLVLNEKQLITCANPNFAAMIGRSFDQIVGKRADEFIKAGMEEPLASLILSSSERKSPGEILTWIRPDGEPVQTTAKSVLISRHGRSESSVLLVITEVTEPDEKRYLEIDDFYMRVMDMSPDMILTLDTRGTITYCNTSAIQQTGYSREEIVGKRFTLLGSLKAGDIPNYLRMFTEVLRGQIPEPFEIQWERKDGGIFDSEVIVSPLRNDDRITGIIAIARNITERKQVESALAGSEERYRLLYENLSDGVFRTDSKGIITMCSPKAADIFGCTCDELLGTNFIQLVHPEDREYIMLTYNESIEREDTIPGGIEARGLRKDGSMNYFHITNTLLMDEGHPAGYQSLIRDVTDRRNAEEAIRVSEQKYRDLFTHSPVSIWEQDFTEIGAWLEELKSSGIQDLDQYLDENPEEVRKALSMLKIDNMNDAALDMYRANSKEQLIDNLDKVFLEETYEGLKQELIAIWNGRPDSLVFESSGLDLEGNRLSTQIIWKVPMVHGTMDLSSAMVVIADITDRVRAEDDLRKSEERYRTIVQSLEDIVFVYDSQNKHAQVYVSEQGLILKPREDLLGKSIEEILPADAAKIQTDAFARVRKTGAGEHIEYPLRLGEKLHWFSATLNLHEDGESIISLVRDITARKETEQELLENEERFALFADNIPGPVFIKDEKSNMLYVNRYMKEMFGIEEGIGKNTAEVFPPEVAKGMIDDDRRAMREGPIHITQFIPDRNGNAHVYQTSKFPIRRENKADLLGGLALDITERTMAEQAIKESEKKYRLLYQSMEDGFVSADNDGNYIEFNRAYVDLSGYEEEELRKLSFWNLTPPQWHEMEKRINRDQILVRGYSDLYEKELQRKDGTVVPIEIRVYLLRDESARPIGTWAIVRDISLRKRAEEELREERDTAQRYLDIAGAAIIVIDVDGRVHLINRRGLEIIGYENGEVLGRNWIDLVVPENDRSKARERFVEILRDETSNEGGFKLTILTKSNEERIISWRYRVLQNDFGNAIGLLASGEDITQAAVAEAALRNSEAKYKQLVEQYTQGVAIIKDPLKIVFANKALGEILGRTSEDLLNLTPEEVRGLLHPEDFAVLISRFEDLMAGGFPREDPMVIRAIRPNGEIRWLEILGRRVEFEGKYAIQIAMTDSTERIRANEKLRDSEERYRRLSDESIQALAILQDGRYVYANPAFASIVGHSLERILSFTAEEVWSLVYPEDREELNRRNEEMQKGGAVAPRHRFRYVRSDGAVRWVESFVKSIEYEGRPAVQVLEIDITARMDSEKALRDSEAKYRKLVEHATLGIMIARAAPIEIAFANDALLKITGLSGDELLSLSGEQIENLIHPDDFEKLVTLMADILEDVTPMDTPLILRVIRNDGKMRWVEVRGSKVEYEEGPAIQATVVDITERRTAERERQKAEDDLKTAADTAMLYLDLLGHDMRNRLQAIQIATELLQFDETRPEALRTIDRVIDLVQSSEALIEKAHATRGLISAPLGNVSLIQTLRNIVKDVEIRFDDLAIETEYKVDQAQIMADEYLSHLLINVLENAVIHNQTSERKMWVTLAEKRGGFELSVADNGEGIDDSLKSILFDQDRRFGGLGLHQSQRIISKYGGSIEVGDRVPGNPTKGAKITLWFPKA
ncbi:MAG: PAS domain S-box protein [Candidatus Thorarchaeota archaeon]|nr:PAS domain S-box protein [Candidatus Thorarchaeota archaeon]